MASLQLEIVTAERIVYSERVDLLVAPGADGELGILPNHSPLLTTLKPGEIRVEQHEFLSRQEIARNRQRHQRCQVGAPQSGCLEKNRSNSRESGTSARQRNLNQLARNGTHHPSLVSEVEISFIANQHDLNPFRNVL